MTGPDAATAYAALHTPIAADLARSLPEIGERLSAQLDELSTRPTPGGAEILAINLDGARRAVCRLREALIREGCGYGQ